MNWITTVSALAAALGFGTIISARINRQTTISTFRQAWINDLRNELAEYFRALDELNWMLQQGGINGNEIIEQRAKASVKVLAALEKIRLRLNKNEEKHVLLVTKLYEFIDDPLGEAMADRIKINEAVELAQDVLKAEWEVIKHPLWQKLRRWWHR